MLRIRRWGPLLAAVLPGTALATLAVACGSTETVIETVVVEKTVVVVQEKTVVVEKPVAQTVIVVASPQPTATTPPAVKSSVLRMATTADPSFLDPHLVQSWGGGGSVSDFVHSRLLKHDATMLNPLPDLAKSWTVSSDGLSITFALRDNVVFHTGRRFSSDDVVWSWDRVKKEIGARGRGLGVTSEVVSYRASSANEFTIQMDRISPVILHNQPNWGLSIVDKDSIAEVNTRPVGTGPYTFVELVPNDRVILQKFPGYWDKDYLAIRPDRIVMVPIRESTTRIASLRAGEVDLIIGLPLQEVPGIKSAKGLKLLEQPNGFTAAYKTIVFNVHHPNTILEPVPTGDSRGPVARVEVRKAIQLAIDKEAINKTVMLGQSDIDCNIIPKTHWGYESLDCPKRDVAKAKTLLAEAGFPNGFKATFHPEESDITRQTALIVKQNLAEIGIDVDIFLLDNPTWNRDVWKGGKFMIATAGYSREPDPDGLMESVFRGKSPTGPWGGNNAMGYFDPEIEKLFDEGKSTTDRAKRKEIYNRIVKKVTFEDVPLIKLGTSPAFWAANERIQGAYIFPQGFWNAHDWIFKP